MSTPALTVLTAYFNPARYHSRQRNYARFARHVRSFAGVRLLTVECAFGRDPFALDDGEAAIRVRAEHPLWVKENLLNLGLARVESPFVAWVDGDVLFQNPRWAEQTIAALHEYRVVQPWSTVYCLDSEGRKMDAGTPAFCQVHQRHYDRDLICHAGYAWAARRDVLEATGGFLEEVILGGADHLMSRAIWDADPGVWPTVVSGPYRDCVNAWCRRFSAAVQRSIGYVDGDIHHLFHGKHRDRRYGERHQLPMRYGYDPARHLRKNADGVNQLVDLPQFCAAIREYFTARHEDIVHTGCEA
jgi:hypothetical protein